LVSGHSVVASGRDRERVSRVLGTSSDLLAVTLDVTNAAEAEAAVRAAVDRFGRIDVLVNNAASFYAGYFEELTPDQIGQQLGASLFGPMNVTRAVLPVMRKQRSGHIISISSSAGLAAGFEFVSAYAASKFGLEGWMESLQAEVAPFSITTTIVNPGFFRTELLTEQSTNYAQPSIADYDERRGPLVEYWKAQNGQQSGDPAKLARALVTIADQNPPPRRFIAGADALAGAEQKIADLKTQIEANRGLSTSLAFDRDCAWLSLVCYAVLSVLARSPAASTTPPRTRPSLQAQRLDERRQRGRLLSPARVVEKVARKRRAPVLKHSHQRATLDQGRDVCLKRKRQPQAIDGRANHEIRIVDNQRAVHIYDQALTVLLELPAIRSRGTAPQVDTAVRR
jgi:NAD(P)-dependent dehydrogenase (short-subunit alcohol dehydrogenase family)